MIFVHEALFWGLLFCSTVVLFSSNCLLIIPMMGVFSLLMVCIYLLNAAVDVAITEAAVGACMSSILLLMAYFYTKPRISYHHRVWWRLLFFAMFIAAVFLVSYLPVSNITNQHVANYYIENTNKDFGINSTVTAILAGYRAYDNLGETIVIFLAALGVIRVLKKS
jgi:multicomponent Na+:H+ antiporter subunit B